MVQVSIPQIPGLLTRYPRRLYVYLPKDYKKTETRYAVLYMFDGQNVFYDSHATYGKSWGMKVFLDKAKLPLLVVTVESNPEGNRRLNEYTPWSYTRREVGRIEAQGAVTMDWFARTLKPEIDRTYRTLPDREHTLIAGSSMGGLMAIYAAVEYNDIFSRAASLSPSLWVAPTKMKALIRARQLTSPTRIYMDMGSGEAAEHRQLMTGLFDTARELTRSGAEVAARVVPGAMHNEAAWEKRVPLFMDYLLN
jgi:predicted alpha/beta superfamily hydrolase